MRNYEGMFLFDPAVLTDWESVQREINRMLERAGAELIVCSRWDERRLAYEIDGRKRGVYALVYFRADPTRITGIERDVQLSESALRCLILRVDQMTEDEMKEAISRSHIEQQAGDGEGDRDRYRDRDRDRDRDDDGGDRPYRRRERREPVESAETSPEE